MKKLLFLIIVPFLIISCSNDGNNDESPQQSDCDPQLLLGTDDITPNSAQLRWDYSGENISFVAEYGLEGFTLGSGTIINTQENSLNISDLSANTGYSFYVKAKCENGEFSEIVGPKNFTTIECPKINSTEVTNITETSAVFFWYESTSATVEIEYGLTGFTTGTGTTAEVFAGNNYRLENLIPSTTYDVYIRTICGDDFSEYSNVETFTTFDNCRTPTDLHLIDTGQFFVHLGWNEQGESAWQVEYGLIGFQLGNGTVLNTSDSTPLIENGINSNTTYEFYVRANCGSEGYSQYIGPLVVSTE